ncbi:asparaginase [Bdellovibrio sp. HCB185ZH]|uniref:asparaginase n=1 Tax=Bdellovibrio sp. HCB185ZH TaxID=3394235 RepID=UPI0039A6269C
MLTRQPLVVEVLRGHVVESVHQVMVAVVNEAGHLLHGWGNTNYATYPRSAIKMLQALPLIESGAADKFELKDEWLALACASHRGEPKHLEALSAWAHKIGVAESALACGPHLPYNEAAAHEFIRHNKKPTAFCNNCAGKHLALISTCLHLGEDYHGYEKHDHAAQKRLRNILTETMKVDHGKIPEGIDGCGIQTYAVPLQAIAIGMSTFINQHANERRKQAAQRLTRVVTSNPFFVAGSDDFATSVIQKTQGRAIIKGGAEGVFAGFLPDKKVAFALKVADGAGRAAQFAASQVLLHLGGMNLDEGKALSKFTQPHITNWKGDNVGTLRIAKPQ